ncbi:MAG: ATP-dependent protease subunit HslV [Fusobacterium sp. JB021]|nr:ATP-dependent protease subunit HslV [Fusobacterium sp. JB021]MDP0507393.1 ATP-dependent protease subunit HslV [Fusobacterium sp. JB019]
MEQMRATTIILARRGKNIAIAGDGQVTLGDTVFKSKAKKIKKIKDYNVLTGFAGGAADSFSLFEKFEKYLAMYKGNVKKASVELANEWRNDKALRNLDAMLIVASKEDLLVLSGNGDIIEPDEDVIAIGSGGNYAYSAGIALLKNTDFSPEKIVLESLKIASSICIYTNSNIVVEKI